jgi:hypothetical protein
LSSLLSDMIAAGHVTCLLARTPWPMHVAVAELYETAAREGDLSYLPNRPLVRPCPSVGRSVEGLDDAFRALVKLGCLVELGEGLHARVRVNPVRLVELRRALMTRDPERARLAQRAGLRWAALAATALNTSASPSLPVGSRVLSATA